MSLTNVPFPFAHLDIHDYTVFCLVSTLYLQFYHVSSTDYNDEQKMVIPYNDIGDHMKEICSELNLTLPELESEMAVMFEEFKIRAGLPTQSRIH
jgi:hypothetical protein